VFQSKSQIEILVQFSFNSGSIINIGLSSNLNLISSNDSVAEFSSKNVFISVENTGQSELSWDGKNRAFRFSFSLFELEVKVQVFFVKSNNGI
jgi:hypothetical protein